MSSSRARALPWWWLTMVGLRKPRHPWVAVDLGASVPAWMLRLGCAIAATCASLLVASTAVHWAVAVVLIVMMTAKPSGATPSLLAVGIGLLLLISSPDLLAPRVFLLAFAAHLTVELAALIGDLPWMARVEWRVVTGAAKPFLAIQALAQATALVGAATASRQPSMTWLPAAAGIALAAMAWAILARLRLDQ